MKKLITLAVVAIAALAVTACGSGSPLTADAAKKPTWTLKSVQREYITQLNDNLASDPITADAHAEATCLLESGTEGKQGTLLCHLDYDDGDTSTVEIVVPPNGQWISTHGAGN